MTERVRSLAFFVVLVVLGALGSGLVAAFALSAPQSASAHDYLVASTPAANSVQTSPIDKVTLTFDDIVLDPSHNGSSDIVQVTGPGSADLHFETGCASVLDRVVTVPVKLGASGTYTVTWQIVSADGHVVSASIAFDYKPPAGIPEAAGSKTRPACGEGDATSRAAPAPSAAASPPSSNLGLVVGIAVGIVVLGIAGVVIVLITSRRRTRS